MSDIQDLQLSHPNQAIRNVTMCIGLKTARWNSCVAQGVITGTQPSKNESHAILSDSTRDGTPSSELVSEHTCTFGLFKVC
jgi:hypothetical protein